MPSDLSDVGRALNGFVARYLEAFPDLYEIHDPTWRSPCEVGEPHAWPDGTQVVRWRPVERRYAEDFAGIENALETTIHADIKAYYGAFWSGGLEAVASEGHVSLILLWNQADAERLTENLIGHALAKQRARAPFSVFFACTEANSELFLSVQNDTGQVMLERPGYKPLRTVAPSLGAFLNDLQPASPFLHPERAALGGEPSGPAA